MKFLPKCALNFENICIPDGTGWFLSIQYTVKPSNISHTKSQNLNDYRLILQLSLPNHWSQVLSRESRCSWCSADRRCSNYIWVIRNFIDHSGVAYIRGLTVSVTGVLASIVLYVLDLVTTAPDCLLHVNWTCFNICIGVIFRYQDTSLKWQSLNLWHGLAITYSRSHGCNKLSWCLKIPKLI